MADTKNRVDSKKSKRKKTEKCRDSMRRLREQIKRDPVRYEEAKRKERERYHARKAAGKIKGIKDMNDREKRHIRKVWRKKFKKQYERKKQGKLLTSFLNETTPPSTPRHSPSLLEEVNVMNNELNIETPPSGQSTSRQSVTGKKIMRKNKLKLKMEINLLKKKLEKSEKRARKYKKRYYRMTKEKTKTNAKDSPGKDEVKRIIEGLKEGKEIKKRLLFGETIASQLKENFKKQFRTKDKQKFVEVISGDIIRQHGYTRYLCKIASHNILYRKMCKPSSVQKTLDAKKLVKEFLSKDENSRQCPGKKDTITYKKLKKQKRYLNDTLKHLYQKFKVAFPTCRISYATFCRFRPFWILQPNVKNRNTCMCILHANISLLISKLKFLKVISENSPGEIVNSLCCSPNSDSCLQRQCSKCKNNEINISEYEKNEYTTYKKWLTKREVLIIKGKEKVCTRTVKEIIHCKKEELCTTFLNSIPKFLLHVRNISHQYGTIDMVKKNLAAEEILIHVDFSENYVCKYAEEVQSAHFGSSKPQVSLHTVVVYHRPTEHAAVTPLSFCTLSGDLRHDPAAICAHLDLVIEEIKKVVPYLNTVHFLSDGPSTQYRNKKMFYLMGVYLSKQLNIRHSLRWHYSESGHGKGAPDGVGGYIKRQADQLVAQGNDISTPQKMLSALNNSSIKVMSLDEEAILKIDKLLPDSLPTFKGTMKCHEVCWSVLSPNTIFVRSLSCLTCSANKICDHYKLGEIDLSGYVNNDTSINRSRLRYEEVYSSSNEDPQEDIHEISSDDDIPLAQYRKENERCITKGTFVVIRLCGKKIIRHYVAQVISVDQNDELTVSFLKKVSARSFQFPEKTDVSVVEKNEIMKILNLPILDEKKDEYFFNENLQYYDHFY